MKKTIKAGDLVTARYLKVDTYRQMVEGMDTAVSFMPGAKVRFRFSDIRLVLYSADHQLSVMTATDKLTVPVNPTNRKHTECIELLLTSLRRTVR